MRRCLCMMVVLMASCMVLGAGPAWAESERTIYFVVVPGVVASGDVEPALFEFKRAVGELAGGYTEMGQTFGATLQGDGSFTTNSNVSFLIASTEDIQAQLVELATTFFGKPPFILSWQGTCNF